MKSGIKDPAGASVETSGYWNPYLGGAALGVALFATLFVTGNGLGASGGVSRLVAAGERLVAPQRVQCNPFLAPLAAGANRPWDHRLFWMLLGTVAGGAVSGWASGRMRWQTCKGQQISNRTRWIMAVLGGALMGYGAGMGRGCTSGQALSGGAVLSVGSWTFMMMVFAGGYLLAYPLRKVWNP